MADEDDLLALVGDLYEAAIDPLAWPRALARYAAATNAVGAHLLLADPQTGAFRFGVIHGVPDEANDDYIRHYAAIDERVPRFLSQPRGRIAQHHDLYAEGERRVSPTYNEFLTKYGDGREQAIMTLDGPDEGVIVWSTIRGSRPGPYQADELVVTASLRRHIQNAVSMSWRLQGLELRAAAAEGALEGAAWGLVLLDHSGRILFMNREARRIAGIGAGLAAGPEGLRGLRQIDDTPLQRLIEGAIGVALGLRLGGGGSMAFPKRSSPRPYAVTVTPLPQREALFPGLRAAAAAVLVVDPDRTPEAPAEALRRVYRLTPAEAAVCQSLAAGRSVAEVAEAQAVRVATVRRHLEAIFRKTGTRRQTELVGLLLRLAQAG